MILPTHDIWHIILWTKLTGCLEARAWNQKNKDIKKTSLSDIPESCHGLSHQAILQFSEGKSIWYWHAWCVPLPRRLAKVFHELASPADAQWGTPRATKAELQSWLETRALTKPPSWRCTILIDFQVFEGALRIASSPLSTLVSRSCFISSSIS